MTRQRKQEQPYGSERPMTLCEAFVRKYLTVEKNSICMQMRRSRTDALNIMTGMDVDEKNFDKSDSVLVPYTWSQFFQQSLQFAKSMIHLGIPERSVITIQGVNSPEHFMAIMGSICSNCVFSDQYLTNSPEACLLQVQHSGTTMIVCDTWSTLKSKYLVNERELLKLGVKTAVIFAEFGLEFGGEGRRTHQKS